MSLKILLADDHHLVRQALRALLESQTDHVIVGEAGDGREVLAEVERLRPDLLVLDLMMPGLNGLEITRQVTQRTPTRVIVVSMHTNEAYVLRALQNGAAGYVQKDAQGSDLLRAIREVAAGRRYLGPPLSESALAAYAERSESPVVDPYETLTTREREVLHLAAEGHGNVEIARILFISPRTAETHRAHFMHKLGLRGQAELTRFALARGLLGASGDPSLPTSGAAGAGEPERARPARATTAVH